MARSSGSSAAMAVLCAVVLLQAMEAKADIASDRSQCTDQLMALATCLQYVSGSSKMPTSDCCAGLKQVLGQSPKCLCILIKDHDDPSLGLKIDPARAMALPENCHAPANISHCPKLLHLSPDSPDGKIFKDFGDATHGNTTTGDGTTALRNTSSSSSSDSAATKGSTASGGISTYYRSGGGSKGWLLGLPVVGWFWVCCWPFASLLLS